MSTLFKSSRTLPEVGYAVVDLETHGLAARTDATVAVYFACVLVVDSNGKQTITTYHSMDLLISDLHALVAAGYWLVYHNSKFDHACLTLRGLRVPISCVIDTMVLAYLQNNQRGEYSLSALTGAKEDLIAALVNEGLLPEPVPLKQFWSTDHSDDVDLIKRLVKYCRKDVKATNALYTSLLQLLANAPEVVAAYFTVDQPMLEALINLEQHGALIDQPALTSLLKDTQTTIAEIEFTIASTVGGCPKLQFANDTFVPVTKEYKTGVYKSSLHVPPFYTDNQGVFVRQWEGHRDNGQPLVVGSYCPLLPFNSNAATGHVWWVINRECPEVLANVKSTKTGKPKINRDFITDVADVLPESFPIGKLAKQVKRNQMATSIANAIQDDGRIRCDFAHTRTLTGRLATSNPNLQNLPRAGKDEDSQRFRKLFVASPGNVLLCADLDQIELRVLAYYLLVGERDHGLADEFNGSDPDAHTKNAATWGVERTVAKTLIFLLVYGGQPKLMVERKLFKTLKEAEAAFAGVKNNQPSISTLMAKVVAKATKQGYVRTLAGRRVYYPDLASSQHQLRSRAERQCFNALIQGSSRDIMHMLVGQSLTYIKAAEANLVNVVHDECIVECKQELAIQLQQQLNGVWEKRTDITPGVTINGSWNIGNNWYEAK